MKLIFLISCIIINSCTIVQSYSEIKAGNSLQLLQDLEIPANNARVSLQYGKVTQFSTVDHYYPHCWFISWNRADHSQIIKAGIFTITEVRETYDYVRQQSSGHIFSSLLANSALTASIYSTELSLYSEKQPNIKRLICSHWEDPEDAQHLSLKQMQQALGSIAKFIIQ